MDPIPGCPGGRPGHFLKVPLVVLMCNMVENHWPGWSIKTPFNMKYATWWVLTMHQAFFQVFTYLSPLILTITLWSGLYYCRFTHEEAEAQGPAPSHTTSKEKSRRVNQPAWLPRLFPLYGPASLLWTIGFWTALWRVLCRLDRSMGQGSLDRRWVLLLTFQWPY